jgi:hypothetical protein
METWRRLERIPRPSTPEAEVEILGHYSKSTLEDVLGAWEKLLKAKSFGDVIDVQTSYARKAYDTYMSGVSKFGKIYLSTAQSAAKPVERATRSAR